MDRGGQRIACRQGEVIFCVEPEGCYRVRCKKWRVPESFFLVEKSFKYDVSFSHMEGGRLPTILSSNSKSAAAVTLQRLSLRLSKLAWFGGSGFFWGAGHSLPAALPAGEQYYDVLSYNYFISSIYNLYTYIYISHAWYGMVCICLFIYIYIYLLPLQDFGLAIALNRGVLNMKFIAFSDAFCMKV